MNDTSTVCQCDIGIAYHVERFLVLFCGSVRSALVQRLVLFAFQLFSFVSLKDFVRRLSFLGKFSKDRIQQSACHIIGASVCGLHFCIILRVHTERKVGRKCPRRCGPCQDVCILILYLEPYNSGALFYVFVSLCHFLCGQRRAAARAVGNDLKSLVEQSLVPDLFQSPPLGLDEAVVICHIRVFHVSPEADRAGEILPHPFVLPHALFTFVDERLQTILFDLILSVQSQCFLNFQFHRKTVCVPSGFSRHHAAFHRAVSRDHILDDTSEHMADMRFSICCRRSIVKDIIRTSLSLFDTLLEDVILVPEFFNFFLSGDEVHIRGYFLVHVDFFLSEGGPSQ